MITLTQVTVRRTQSETRKEPSQHEHYSRREAALAVAPSLRTALTRNQSPRVHAINATHVLQSTTYSDH